MTLYIGNKGLKVLDQDPIRMSYSNLRQSRILLLQNSFLCVRSKLKPSTRGANNIETNTEVDFVFDTFWFWFGWMQFCSVFFGF